MCFRFIKNIIAITSINCNNFCQLQLLLLLQLLRLYKVKCHWRIFYIGSANLLDNSFVSRLFECNLEPFKCPAFIEFPWSIKSNFFFFLKFSLLALLFKSFVTMLIFSTDSTMGTMERVNLPYVSLN